MALSRVGEGMKTSAGRKGNAYWVRSKRLLRLGRDVWAIGGGEAAVWRRFRREKEGQTSALRGWKLNNNNSIPNSHGLYL
jgi:hypothetical protein